MWDGLFFVLSHSQPRPGMIRALIVEGLAEELSKGRFFLLAPVLSAWCW